MNSMLPLFFVWLSLTYNFTTAISSNIQTHGFKIHHKNTVYNITLTIIPHKDLGKTPHHYPNFITLFSCVLQILI